jgi:hypothetical protein
MASAPQHRGPFPSHRFSDCAPHDVMRDKATVQCYAVPPRFAKKPKKRTSATRIAAQVYGRKGPASEQKIGTTGPEGT